ncbi:unnamed protein product [Ilex paraguariensis]|uniref:Uncharacterized protein n=1 Tax=Ilex paraguariensis TaxID=185542 RepID=A0ABC8T0Z1_9AQUA
MQSGSSEQVRSVAAATDTRGKHRISAELKRLEQEARFLESHTGGGISGDCGSGGPTSGGFGGIKSGARGGNTSGGPCGMSGPGSGGPVRHVDRLRDSQWSCF